MLPVAAQAGSSMTAGTGNLRSNFQLPGSTLPTRKLPVALQAGSSGAGGTGSSRRDFQLPIFVHPNPEASNSFGSWKFLTI
ncbi:MAG: hypothetical protein EA393_09600 [Bacteroidetes bacterium]|nr:MAG: hypothetical protein EA393_09600 [Bacteroidota bacterium]